MSPVGSNSVILGSVRFALVVVQYRRLRSKLGAPKAITAMAHKLARLVYRMLKYGQDYVDKGMQYYEDRHRRQQIELLQKSAAKLGLQIVEIQAVGG